MLKRQFVLAIMGVLGLAILGSTLLDLWTQGRVTMNTPLFHWLLLSAFAAVFWQGGITVLKAANRHVRAATLFIVGSAVTVVVAYILLRWTGRLADAGLALVLLDCLMTSYVLHAAWQMIHALAPARDESSIRTDDTEAVSGLRK